MFGRWTSLIVDTCRESSVKCTSKHKRYKWWWQVIISCSNSLGHLSYLQASRPNKFIFWSHHLKAFLLRIDVERASPRGGVSRNWLSTFFQINNFRIPSARSADAFLSLGSIIYLNFYYYHQFISSAQPSQRVLNFCRRKLHVSALQVGALNPQPRRLIYGSI